MNKEFSAGTTDDSSTNVDGNPVSPTCPKPNVGSSTSTKELFECTVCWGGGKIEIDDYGNEEDCTWCNGTGLVGKGF